MPRKFLKRFMPHPRHAHHHHRWGKLIHNPNLWHLNRHSVARGISLGVFWSFTPLPLVGQTLFATILAIRIRANVALAAAFTWVVNPLTYAPAVYLSYTLGRLILRQPPLENFRPTWDCLKQVWLSYALGAMCVAISLSSLTYLLSQNYWKWRIQRRWRARNIRANSDANICL